MNVLHRCTGHANYGKARNECPEIEMEDFVTDSLKFIRELESPRFIKSHLPFCLLPKQLTNFSTEAKVSAEGYYAKLINIINIK